MLDLSTATLMEPELRRLWFTSDQHWVHPNIIEHCRRPFGSVEEMNEGLVRSWNETIPEKVGRSEPVVVLLGDVIFGREGQDWTKDSIRKLLARLHGRIYLIEGNHDRQTEIAKWCDRFEAVHTQLEIKFRDPLFHPTEKGRIVCNHYRMTTWNGAARGSFHCYGHWHGSDGIWPTLEDLANFEKWLHHYELDQEEHGSWEEYAPQVRRGKERLQQLRRLHNVRALDVAWDKWRKPLSYPEVRDWMLQRSPICLVDADERH